jgi:hypothetical protein
MPKQIPQVDQATFETQPDRMVSEKVNEILNGMPDASGRRDHGRDPTVKAGKIERGGTEAQGHRVRVGGHRTPPAAWGAGRRDM